MHAQYYYLVFYNYEPKSKTTYWTILDVHHATDRDRYSAYNYYWQQAGRWRDSQHDDISSAASLTLLTTVEVESVRILPTWLPL